MDIELSKLGSDLLAQVQIGKMALNVIVVTKIFLPTGGQLC